jgi:hypothetical protein
MQHLPFPAIEVARDVQQAAVVGAAGGSRKLRLAAQLSRRAPDVARLADPLEPLIERPACELRRRVNAPGHIGKGHG